MNKAGELSSRAARTNLNKRDRVEASCHLIISTGIKCNDMNPVGELMVDTVRCENLQRLSIHLRELNNDLKALLNEIGKEVTYDIEALTDFKEYLWRSIDSFRDRTKELADQSNSWTTLFHTMSEIQQVVDEFIEAASETVQKAIDILIHRHAIAEPGFGAIFTRSKQVELMIAGGVDSQRLIKSRLKKLSGQIIEVRTGLSSLIAQVLSHQSHVKSRVIRNAKRLSKKIG